MDHHNSTASHLGQISRSTINEPCHPGAIPPLTARILRMTEQMREISIKLSIHADAVHGACPENAAGSSAAVPCRSGAIGALEDALDELERAHSMVAAEAGRNCTLA